jgi:hypothetical protein
MADTKNEITLASNGKTYEAKPAQGCTGCAFKYDSNLCLESHEHSYCYVQRSDGVYVIWREDEKC